MEDSGPGSTVYRQQLLSGLADEFPHSSKLASSTLSGRSSPPEAASAPPGLVGLSTGDTGCASSSSLLSPATAGVVLSVGDLRMARVRRGLLSAADVIQEELQAAGVGYRAALVTATYRPGVAWGPRHVAAALKCLREWARRRRTWVKYVWRLEFTRRGVPHYHVVVWLPRGRTMPRWDKRGWWPHGMTNAVWARRPVGYLAKYAAKAADWPPGTRGTHGARWFGVGGLSLRGRLRALWRGAPAWVRERWPEGEPLKRLSGSWWRLGSFVELRSPWALEVVGDGCAFRWRGWTPDDVRFVVA